MSVLSLAPAGAPGGRLIAADNGTSFSAPQVAREITSIAARYPAASANLLRALAAISGDQTDITEHNGSILSTYGEPLAARVLESGTHRVVLFYEGQIQPSSTLIHTLPIPSGFATGRYSQQIKVALAFDPPVRRSRREYLASDMDFQYVRNMAFDEVQATYSRQPTRAEQADDPSLERFELPGDRRRPDLLPSSSRLKNNTLICRTLTGSWDPNDEGYYLVVTHGLRPWADIKGFNEPQRYALAVELSLSEDASIDLYASIQAELQATAQVRGRVRV